MVALTKSEMAERLFEELGLNKREAKDTVELFFEEISGCLENNEQKQKSWLQGIVEKQERDHQDQLNHTSQRIQTLDDVSKSNQELAVRLHQGLLDVNSVMCDRIQTLEAFTSNVQGPDLSLTHL